MKHPAVHVAILSTVAVGCLWAAACDFSLNGSITPKGTFTVDPGVDTDNITPGQEVEVALTAEDTYLCEPDETPPPEHEEDAGHFQIYLDDLDSEPLLITAETNVTVTMPAEIEPGDHKLKCRIHKHDGTPTATVIEVNITVTVSTGGEGEGEGE